MKTRSQTRTRHTVTQALRHWQDTLAAVPTMLRDQQSLDTQDIDDLIAEIQVSRITLRKRSTREFA